MHDFSLPWTKLRTVGNSNLVKLTIVIPLVGYLILFNEHLLQYTELSRTLLGIDEAMRPEASSATAAHVSLRLLSLYFGLCLVAVASAIHQWFTPDEIKKYASSAEYVEREQDHLSNQAYARLEMEMETADDPEVTRELIAIRIANSERPSPPSIEELRRRFSETQRDVMDLRFRTLNNSRAWARRLTASLYSVGFVAIVVPSIDVFFRVCRLFVRTLILG